MLDFANGTHAFADLPFCFVRSTFVVSVPCCVGTTWSFTEALTFLFALDVAVIVTRPSALPFTRPVLETEATFALLDFHVTVLLAFCGFTDFTLIWQSPLIPTEYLHWDCSVIFFGLTVFFFVFFAAKEVVWAMPEKHTVTTRASRTTIALRSDAFLDMNHSPFNVITILYYVNLLYELLMNSSNRKIQ